ncbi:hypothetical protein M0R45_003897 [Rubus argutus]|uniref:Uncharacterized protein n=1 Tax=Rubus argutus TaxID=59490 RepID=A0AAW1YGI3_RUBAR
MAQAIIGPHFCIVDKEAFLSLRDRRVLVDAHGYPIVTLQKKMLSTHHIWKVYRGDSTDSSNLVFSVKKSSMFQWKKKLHVFLRKNTGEYAPDFKVKGNWFEQSCVVYAGKSKSSNIVVAQMHTKHTVTSVLFGKDNFMVTVYPGIDYAFIVALVIILDEMNSSGSSSGSVSGGA